MEHESVTNTLHHKPHSNPTSALNYPGCKLTVYRNNLVLTWVAKLPGYKASTDNHHCLGTHVIVCDYTQLYVLCKLRLLYFMLHCLFH